MAAMLTELEENRRNRLGGGLLWTCRLEILIFYPGVNARTRPGLWVWSYRRWSGLESSTTVVGDKVFDGTIPSC